MFAEETLFDFRSGSASAGSGSSGSSTDSLSTDLLAEHPYHTERRAASTGVPISSSGLTLVGGSAAQSGGYLMPSHSMASMGSMGFYPMMNPVSPLMGMGPMGMAMPLGYGLGMGMPVMAHSHSHSRRTPSPVPGTYPFDLRRESTSSSGSALLHATATDWRKLLERVESVAQRLDSLDAIIEAMPGRVKLMDERMLKAACRYLRLDVSSVHFNKTHLTALLDAACIENIPTAKKRRATKVLAKMRKAQAAERRRAKEKEKKKKKKKGKFKKSKDSKSADLGSSSDTSTADDGVSFIYSGEHLIGFLFSEVNECKSRYKRKLLHSSVRDDVGTDDENSLAWFVRDEKSWSESITLDDLKALFQVSTQNRIRAEQICDLQKQLQRYESAFGQLPVAGKKKSKSSRRRKRQHRDRSKKRGHSKGSGGSRHHFGEEDEDEKEALVIRMTSVETFSSMTSPVKNTPLYTPEPLDLDDSELVSDAVVDDELPGFEVEVVGSGIRKQGDSMRKTVSTSPTHTRISSVTFESGGLLLGKPSTTPPVASPSLTSAVSRESAFEEESSSESPDEDEYGELMSAIAKEKRRTKHDWEDFSQKQEHKRKVDETEAALKKGRQRTESETKPMISSLVDDCSQLLVHRPDSMDMAHTREAQKAKQLRDRKDQRVGSIPKLDDASKKPSKKTRRRLQLELSEFDTVHSTAAKKRDGDGSSSHETDGIEALGLKQFVSDDGNDGIGIAEKSSLLVTTGSGTQHLAMDLDFVDKMRSRSRGVLLVTKKAAEDGSGGVGDCEPIGTTVAVGMMATPVMVVSSSVSSVGTIVSEGDDAFVDESAEDGDGVGDGVDSDDQGESEDLLVERLTVAAMYEGFSSRALTLAGEYKDCFDNRVYAWNAWRPLVAKRRAKLVVDQKSAQQLVDFARMALGRYANWLFTPGQMEHVRQATAGGSEPSGKWTAHFAMTVEFNFFCGKEDMVSRMTPLEIAESGKALVLSFRKITKIEASPKNSREFWVYEGDVRHRFRCKKPALCENWVRELNYQKRIVSDLCKCSLIDFMPVDVYKSLLIPYVNDQPTPQ